MFKLLKHIHKNDCSLIHKLTTGLDDSFNGRESIKNDTKVIIRNVD